MPNVFELRARKEIEAEASAWIVQLHGKKPTEEDLRALGEWMRRSPSHREALARYAAVWDQTNALSALLEEVAAASVARAEERAEQKARRLSLGAPAFVAGAAALGLLAFALTTQLGAGAAQASYATAVGEQHMLALADGSDVLLNTASQVRAAYTRDARVVYLERGEALFSVAADPHRPFVLHAGDAVVRAVGTVFAVRMGADGAVDVTVSEGAVEVASGGGAPRRVSANQACTLSPAGAGAPRTLDDDALTRTLAWRSGTLMFRGERLEYVVAEIARYTGDEFVFADPALKDMRIGGYFRVGEVDGLLVALEGSFGVEVRREGERRIVLASGPAR